MAPTTEICTLALVAGSEIGDPNNAASAVLKECGDVLSQQDGQQTFQFGTSVENPGDLQLFINWDGKSDHEKFMASDTYPSFVKTFSTIFTGSPQIVHVDFEPAGGAKAAMSAPITEIATFYYDNAPPEDSFAGAKKLVEALQKDGQNIYGWAFGKTHEVIERDGAKGHGNVLVIGWETVQAHLDARQTQAFKDNIHHLRTPQVKAAEVHHVAIMNYLG